MKVLALSVQSINNFSVQFRIMSEETTLSMEGSLPNFLTEFAEVPSQKLSLLLNLMEKNGKVNQNNKTAKLSPAATVLKLSQPN